MRGAVSFRAGHRSDSSLERVDEPRDEGSILVHGDAVPLEGEPLKALLSASLGRQSRVRVRRSCLTANILSTMAVSTMAFPFAVRIAPVIRSPGLSALTMLEKTYRNDWRQRLLDQ